MSGQGFSGTIPQPWHTATPALSERQARTPRLATLARSPAVLSFKYRVCKVYQPISIFDFDIQCSGRQAGTSRLATLAAVADVAGDTAAQGPQLWLAQCLLARTVAALDAWVAGEVQAAFGPPSLDAPEALGHRPLREPGGGPCPPCYSHG